ncbi:uncharacterized protein Z518_10860 [Rhinocladiella mackenziei CBS 650.93]|uniref:Transcription factor domain-containing protein n=1 Tax=Rhinocladiella mackenziei CBS 650.93 TaxID=1442369 RepID=A0A0D2GNJ3_9EURO|nr:uncharacterized protein Z518_10860 [Rhinocladiella mackenziei CBS 650.93]KIW99932.1 hypothetical protein Z518_10860 [Rhinocladiella mackenziei CBS 650.93]
MASSLTKVIFGYGKLESGSWKTQIEEAAGGLNLAVLLPVSEIPCVHCQKTSRTCVFHVPSTNYTSTPTADPSSVPEQQDSVGSYREECDNPKASEATIHAANRKPPDICLRIGKLSITDRIGGMLRANYVESLEDLLQEKVHLLEASDQFSAPVVAWFKPHSSLPLGQLYSANKNQTIEIDVSEEQRQALLDRYFVSVHPVCSVASRNDLLADDPVADALRWAMFYAAAVSMPLLESQKLFGMSKDSLVKKLKKSAEDALSKADIVTHLDLRLFQALVIYLTPQFLSEVSRSHSVYIAAVIRHFQIAGFDQDAEQDTDAVRQTKRHLWQHLLFLNIRAIEAVGPERTVIDDPYSLMPELDEYRYETASESFNSDCILALIRYECYRIHRIIFRERENFKRGRSTFVSFLGTLEQLKLHVQTKYLDHLDERIPLHKYAGLVGKLLLARSDGMTIHSQRVRWQLPNEGLNLRERAIQSGLDVCETAVLLETDPDLANWAWYAPAYQQYHSILFLLVSIYQTPELPEGDRIMTMIDHVFGPSTVSSGQIRSMTVLKALKDNMASFLAAVGSPNYRLPRGKPPHQPGPHMLTPPTDSLTVAQGSTVGDQNLTYFDVDSMSPSITAEDIWWPWPPQMPLLEQGDSFGPFDTF